MYLQQIRAHTSDMFLFVFWRKEIRISMKGWGFEEKRLKYFLSVRRNFAREIERIKKVEQRNS